MAVIAPRQFAATPPYETYETSSGLFPDIPDCCGARHEPMAQSRIGTPRTDRTDRHATCYMLHATCYSHQPALAFYANLSRRAGRDDGRRLAVVTTLDRQMNVGRPTPGTVIHVSG